MIKMDHFNLVTVEFRENMKVNVSVILASCGKVILTKHLVFKWFLWDKIWVLYLIVTDKITNNSNIINSNIISLIITLIVISLISSDFFVRNNRIQGTNGRAFKKNK